MLSTDFSRINGADILKLKSKKVAIIKTEWNADIVNTMDTKCEEALKIYGVDVLKFIVPGAIEIPFVINQCALHIKNIDAFIALGCVVKGDTPHFDYVCNMLSAGINHLNLSLQIPCIMGVLTVNNFQQAVDRINGENNKGLEFALATLKMILLNINIKTQNNFK